MCFGVVGNSVGEHQSFQETPVKKDRRLPIIGCIAFLALFLLGPAFSDYINQRRKIVVVVNDLPTPVQFKSSVVGWKEFQHGDYLSKRTLWPGSASFRVKIDGKDMKVNCTKNGKWQDDDLCQVLLSEVSP
ncbi:MAG: hypothetical protein KDC26_09165 [Armatimonadetes bacterium]|nr:hypothetical protein [Armatimonadota bacterium]